MRPRLAVATLAAVTVLWLVPTAASTKLPADFRVTVTDATVIVRGRVTDVRAVRSPRGEVETVATIAAPGLEARVGWRVTEHWAVGVTGSWSRPDFETRISDDVEDAEPVIAALGMDRFTVELDVERRFGRSVRWQPYARLAAGWLRELADNRALADSGVAAHAGGGLKYWMREGRPGWLGHIALRAEARLALRRGGITLGDAGHRWSPTVAAGIVIAR